MGPESGSTGWCGRVDSGYEGQGFFQPPDIIEVYASLSTISGPGIDRSG